MNVDQDNRNLLSLMDHRVCGIVVFCLYGFFLFPAMPSVGDAADYGALIRQGEFSIRTVHIGYYLFAYPFVMLGHTLGLSTTLSLNLLSATCMALAVAFSNLFYMSLGCHRSVCNLAALIFGTSGIIWYHAEFGELQALLVLQIVVSLYAFLKERPILSAGVYAFALLTSQAAAPIGLCFLLFAYWKKSWQLLVKFSVACSLMFAIGVAPIAGDYFFGPRGLFPSMGYYQTGPVSKMLLYFAYRLLENHTVWLAPLAVGVVSSLKEAKPIVVLTLVMWIPHAWVNLKLGHIEYGFAWMPLFLMTSLMASLGAHVIWRRFSRSMWVGLCSIGALFALGALLTYFLYLAPKNNDAVEMTALIRATADETKRGEVVASPYVGFVYVYETAPETADVWKSNWITWPQASSGWETIMQSSRPVFLLVSKPHTHVFRRWLFGNAFVISLIGSERSQQFLMEGDSAVVEEAIQYFPSGFILNLVAEHGSARLYRVGKYNPSM
jgi:hypothetical protein